MCIRWCVQITVWIIAVTRLSTDRAGRRRSRVVVLNRGDGAVASRSVSGRNIPVTMIRRRSGSGMLGVICSSPTPTLAFGMGNLSDGNRLDGPMDSGINVLHWNTAVDNGAVVDVVIIDDGGLVENLPTAFLFGAVITRMTFGKAIHGNEGETFRAQPEIKANCHTRPTIKKSHARTIYSERRQRRPAAIVIIRTPSHPRWRPDRVRPPAPAHTRVMKPTPIMKRHTPQIIGIPIPTVVTINPVAAITIWLPGGIINHRRRPPATPIALDFHPRTVG